MARAKWHVLASAAGAMSLLLAPVGALADQQATLPHVVQPGETLSQIAFDAGLDESSLAALNGLDDANMLIAGQTLKLPGTASPALQATPQPTHTYTVAEGDTLWSIAQQFGTTTDTLVEINALDDPNHVVLGAVLTLPSAAATAAPVASATSAAVATSAPVTTPPATSHKSLLVPYTVQAGETLSGIARQFDVRPDTIATASGLDDPNKLSVGSVLKVPLPGKEHVVSAGETLRDIAAAERVDLGSLIDFNDLADPSLIRVGQVVLVPVGASQKPPQAAATPQPAQSSPPAPPPTATPAPAPVVVAASIATTPPTPAASPTQAPAPKPAPPKPAAPLVVVPAPKDAPTDGLAGAGLKLLGSPYVFGGSSPAGFDCSGFVWYVARQAGKSINRGMLGEYNSGPHPAREELKAGDLVFFQNTYSAGLSHNGIYIGNGQFVHAADETDGVTISSLNTAYWSEHWFGATRIS